MKLSRGDIFYADLDPVIGSEQGGIRPVVIIQNDIGNQFSQTTIIAPVTTQIKKSFQPTHVKFYIKNEYLEKDNMILLEQIRTIDIARLKCFVGTLSLKDMKKLDKALAVSVGLLKEKYN